MADALNLGLGLRVFHFHCKILPKTEYSVLAPFKRSLTRVFLAIVSPCTILHEYNA